MINRKSPRCSSGRHHAGVTLTLSFAALVLLGCGSSGGGALNGFGTDGGASRDGSVLGAGGVLFGIGGAATAGSGGAVSSGGTAACVGANCGAGTAPVGKAANAICAAPAECASGRCEPVTGVAKTVCLAACFADGAPCTKALDCCSTGCFDGVCGGACTLEGQPCQTNAECCENICTDGQCQVDLVNRDCRPTGEDCSSGSGSGCCNDCDKQTHRCAFAADTCFGQGVACQTDANCCHGSCLAGVCKTPCQANGTACTASAACCSADCGAGGLCVAKPAADGGVSACHPTGARCVTAADCCSQNCFGGFCEAVLH